VVFIGQGNFGQGNNHFIPLPSIPLPPFGNIDKKSWMLPAKGLEIYEPLQLKDWAAAARAIAGEQVLGRAIVDLQELGREPPVAAACRIPAQSAAILMAGAKRSRDERRSSKGFHLPGDNHRTHVQQPTVIED